MKIDLVFLLVIGILVIYQLCSKNVENMADVSNDIKEGIRQVYLADVDAIRNLSSVATKLQAGGLTNPGHMNVNGKMNIGTAAPAKDLPDWLNLSVENGGDSHIRLKTKNDDNKNMYLINRDGHFRVHHHGVGDMLSLNHDGHFSTTHTGDHVAHFVGRGAHPYITLSKEGEWGNKSWYMQNVHNSADGNNNSLRFGVHDVGQKVEFYKDGNIVFGGRNLMGELNALREEVNSLKANTVKYNDVINITNSDTGNHEGHGKYIGFCGGASCGGMVATVLTREKGRGILRIERN